MRQPLLCKSVIGSIYLTGILGIVLSSCCSEEAANGREDQNEPSMIFEAVEDGDVDRSSRLYPVLASLP